MKALGQLPARTSILMSLEPAAAGLRITIFKGINF
jgi:threonine/homoserine efflux transporter RhtA